MVGIDAVGRQAKGRDRIQPYQERRMSLWIMATFAMLPLWVLPLPAWAGDPTDAVRNTSEAIVRILEDPDLRKPDRIVQRRTRLDAAIGALLTYEGMSRQVLGPQWDKLGPEEEQEFVHLFRSLLTKMYADKVEQYASMPIHFLSERQQLGYAEVQTKTVSAKTEFHLDFRLVEKAGERRVYDILMDGVSLINNYRQQFQRMLRLASYEQIVTRLRERAEQPMTVVTR